MVEVKISAMFPAKELDNALVAGGFPEDFRFISNAMIKSWYEIATDQWVYQFIPPEEFSKNG